MRNMPTSLDQWLKDVETLGPRWSKLTEAVRSARLPTTSSYVQPYDLGTVQVTTADGRCRGYIVVHRATFIPVSN